SSDIVEAALRYKDRSRESHEFELLDPNNSDEKLNESETELLMESDINSKDE
ncbi:9932_t:CDS:2, partial [Gigaspora rosea]